MKLHISCFRSIGIKNGYVMFSELKDKVDKGLCSDQPTESFDDWIRKEMSNATRAITVSKPKNLPSNMLRLRREARTMERIQQLVQFLKE